MSEKITLVISMWILSILIIVGNTNLELFFILIFIGILIIRELTDVFIKIDIKERMNLLIYIFLIGFIILVGNKIVNIFGT